MADESTGASRRPARSAAVVLLRRGLLLVVVLLVVEYLVVPRLMGAGRNVDLLSRIHVGWLLVSLLLEAAALFAYALLTRALLDGGGPRLTRIFGITLSTTAITHVAPGGFVTGPSLGYSLLTAEGVAGAEAAFILASQAVSSAIVLNVLLWLALMFSIPFAGVHPVYLVVAVLGVAALALVAGLVYAFTRGEEGAVRTVRAVGRRIPRVGADRLETVVRRIGDSVAHLGREPRLLRWVTLWAALNWLLDAAALWAFLAAFGRAVSPAELFVAYGVANVLAVIPLVPAGLGVIEATSISLLVGFGVASGVATFAVLGWRLVNFWLPIPVGALAYLTLRLTRHRRRPVSSAPSPTSGEPDPG